MKWKVRVMMDMLAQREAKRDFIHALVHYSNGLISEREAISMTEQYFCSSHIYEGSPLTHKGIHILAKHLLSSLNML